VTAAGCGGTSNTDPGSTSSGGGSTAVATSSTGSGNTLGEAFSVSFDPIKLAPGEEDTRCVVKRVGNEAALHIGTIHNELSSASHHLIVYLTSDIEEQTTPFPCQAFSNLLKPAEGAPIVITQKHDDTLALPKGIALPFGADQLVRLEMHYINTTTSDIEASAQSTFYAMPKEEVTAEAAFFFGGNPDIKIAAHSQHTLGPTFIPLPAEIGEPNFFGITGHTHQYGTNVRVATAAEKLGQATPVYEVSNWLWGEPTTIYHDPPFKVPEFGGFQLTCDWNNTSNKSLQFGESANDEMCFFWAYYYPAKGTFLCAHTDKVPGGYDMCCPGDGFCTMFFD
jgi:hypothetical protein